ncbi:MAG: PmoA family protein [Planctomycetota bacterium]
MIQRSVAFALTLLLFGGTLADDLVLKVEPKHSGRNVPCAARVENAQPGPPARLVDEAGSRLPCQWGVADGDGAPVLRWVEPDLAAGKALTRRLVSAEDVPADAVKLTQADGKVDVAMNGALFTSYNFSPSDPKPYCWPIIGPTGKPVTRAFPMVKDVPGEQHDHHHHRSWFFTFGSVNGTCFWSETDKSGVTRHLKFERLVSGPVFGEIVARNAWVTKAGKKELEDVRTYRFYKVTDGFLVDWEITLLATEGPVVMGDTKEGMASFRVASSMIDKNGGKLTDSEGHVNADCWGKQAKWCDFSGPVEGETVGIAMFDHPASFRHPTYWHSRTYGLFGANPFGLSQYLKDKAKDGSHTIPKGDSLKFTYRVYVHKGSAEEANLAEKYASYAEPPNVTVMKQ